MNSKRLVNSNLFIFEFTYSREGIDWLVIKRFIKKIEETATEALVTILYYIDDKLDSHEKRIKNIEDRIDDFEDKFSPTIAEVESQSSTRKLMKKTAITTGIGIFIGWVLKHFGIF